MDFLFVKTKGRTGTFRKVVSNETVYENIPVFDDNRPYNDELKLRDNQWFVLDHFSQKDYATDLVKNAFNAAAWSQIDRTDYEKIDYLVAVQSDGNILGNYIPVVQNRIEEKPSEDLEKEIDDYLEPIKAWQIQEAPFTNLENCARHFYELGLNARKEE